MQTIDDAIVKLLNALAQNVGALTYFMSVVVHNNMIKGGIVIALVWYLWFKKDIRIAEFREKLTICLLACIVAIFAGRLLAILLPYRPRPILNSTFNFPYQIDQFSWLNTWSSFPSDHAVLFFSLATGIFSVSRKLGIISYLYILVVICLPRMYLGMHYFSDILVGALIGVFIFVFLSRLGIFVTLSKRLISVSDKFPGIFYSGFFLLSYQIATLFEESRDLLKASMQILQKVHTLLS